jgi:hypothetical protein
MINAFSFIKGYNNIFDLKIENAYIGDLYDYNDHLLK